MKYTFTLYIKRTFTVIMAILIKNFHIYFCVSRNKNKNKNSALYSILFVVYIL